MCFELSVRQTITACLIQLDVDRPGRLTKNSIMSVSMSRIDGTRTQACQWG